MKRIMLWFPVFVLVGALASALLVPRVAEAHSFLVRSRPQPGARLGSSPAAITLQFSEAVAGGQVKISAANGASVALGPLQHLQNGLVLRAPLAPLNPDVYIVSWHVVAADDGHETDGELAFAVGAAGQLPGPLGQTVSAVAWPEAFASWLFLFPLFLVVGGLASERLIWAPVARRHRVAIPSLPAFKGRYFK